MKMLTLEDLFVQELRDIYNGENQIIKALPKMAKAASSPDLKQAFENHLAQTEEQVERLDRIFKKLGKKPTGKKCKPMEGLIEEGKELMEMDAEPAVLDAALIAAAQKVEHYEIALYGCLCTWAKLLGYTTAQHTLHQTLEEEKRTDEKLTQLAERQVNLQAAAK